MVKKLGVIVAALAATAAAFGLAGAASADDSGSTTNVTSFQDKNCGDYPSQEAAQAALPTNTGLDGDKDGQACESYDYGDGGSDDNGSDDNGPDPGDKNCADYSSQTEAQAALEADPSDPNNLDADDDGQACEAYDYGDDDGGSAPTPTPVQTEHPVTG